MKWIGCRFCVRGMHWGAVTECPYVGRFNAKIQ
jgi:hypothetical protein